MLVRFRQWFTHIPIQDSIKHRQAMLLQGLYIIFLVSSCLGIGVILTNNGPLQVIGIFGYSGVIAVTFVALWLLHRGYFAWSVYSIAITIVLMTALSLVQQSLVVSGATYMALLFPLVLVGLTLGRRALIIISVLNAIVVMISWRRYPNPLTAAELVTSMPPYIVMASFILFSGVIAFMIDQFSSALRTTLTKSQEQRDELNMLRQSLEDTVEQRTASLQQALANVEQREAALQTALSKLQTSQTLIQQLSFPILPVLPDVLLAPLVGTLNAERMHTFTSELPRAVVQERVRAVVIDVTGTQIIDRQIAQELLQMQSILKLLGAQVVFVGLRPEVAQTLVSLDMDWRSTRIYADLRDAINVLAREKRV